eukprot:CAMPEP_0172008634 /NCGR_PEP_ID=MMETSP1041-20130122/6751_1 /TAXON_ID=464988 /ORGANISM="Hemiselmis andersenii, Strain CCMP439" /LENGTH=61 /DNA_ID=CAMNT_0012662841 /DNA_START=343 /DNA_END=524 /DNA_ORIENTATION=-
MSLRAVTMYGPVLHSFFDPPSLTFAASSLVSASRCCHEETFPVSVPTSSIVFVLQIFTVLS